jgi:signal transduction histidine kinase
VLLVAGIVLITLFRQSAVDRFDSGLGESITSLYAEATVDDSGQVFAPPMTDARAFRLYSGHYWQIAGLEKGKLAPIVRSRSLWDSALDAPPEIITQLHAKAGRSVFFDDKGPLGEPLRVGAQLVRLQGRKAPVVFMAADNRTALEKDSAQFAYTLSAALALVAVGLIAAVLLQVRVGLEPLFTLRREVEGVRKGRKERLDGSYPRELEPLAAELNALMAHNQDVVERQRTHVGNLAHALKTPLSVMLTEAAQQGGALASVVTEQAGLMHGQVDHHLRRARAAARSQNKAERTLVAPVLDELARTLERIFRDKGLEIDWRCDDDLAFQGERQDFLELAGNVMENAGKWSRRRVWAVAEPLGDDKLTVTIDDDGPGLPADRRADVLKRGARLDESAPGSGLGLSIVDDLARAYGGGVALADAPAGGLRAVLTLPRAEG